MRERLERSWRAGRKCESASGALPTHALPHTHAPARPPTHPQTHRMRIKYIIIATSRLMARSLVDCRSALSYTLTATRRPPRRAQIAE